MLTLFDIDGTILRSQRVGVRAMQEAGQQLYGASFSLSSVEVSGRLDPLIWRDAVSAHGIEPTEEARVIFQATYTEILRSILARESVAYLLPGVESIVTQLAERSDVTVALLTGNYPVTGRMKIEAAGLDPELFVFGAFGDDAPSRRDLPPVAFARYSDVTGGAIDPRQTVIIGDTKHDVDCAKANGCRSLAVGTGRTSAEELEVFGADLTLRDLSSVNEVIDWIISPDAVPS